MLRVLQWTFVVSDSLQLLKGCDEHVTLSKAELDMGNERLAAEHCSMASGRQQSLNYQSHLVLFGV